MKEGAVARFRQLAMKSFGFGKGAISKAATVAIDDWMNRVETRGKRKGSIESLVGLAKDIKGDSVSLQHSALKKWLEKAD